MVIDETVRNICNTETKNVLWSKGERRMKYEKPEMEILKFKEDQVFTLYVSGSEGSEGNIAPGNETGNEW